MLTIILIWLEFHYKREALNRYTVFTLDAILVVATLLVIMMAML